MKGLLKYNLQFFAEGDDNGTDNDTVDSTNIGDNTQQNGVDTEAFAELISERDKKIETLEAEMKALRKSNADLLVKISTGGTTAKKTFDENLLDMVGYKPRKE